MNEQHPATIKIIKGQQHAPEEGSEILITTLQTMQKRLDEPDSKLNAQNARISRLETLSKPYLDIRERCFTTHLRSFWRDFIIPSDVEMTLGETRALIKSLVGLHGGHAEADAIMFEERRPARELRPFVHIYGVQPATIREIGRSCFLFVIVVMLLIHVFMIVSKGYKGCWSIPPHL